MLPAARRAAPLRPHWASFAPLDLVRRSAAQSYTRQHDPVVDAAHGYTCVRGLQSRTLLTALQQADILDNNPTAALALACAVALATPTATCVTGTRACNRVTDTNVWSFPNPAVTSPTARGADVLPAAPGPPPVSWCAPPCLPAEFDRLAIVSEHAHAATLASHSLRLKLTHESRKCCPLSTLCGGRHNMAQVSPTPGSNMLASPWRATWARSKRRQRGSTIWGVAAHAIRGKRGRLVGHQPWH